MSLEKSTVLDLGAILKQKFNMDMDYIDLEKFATSLVGYFELLNRIEQRDLFENRPQCDIDQIVNQSDNNKDEE